MVHSESFKEVKIWLYQNISCMIYPFLLFLTIRLKRLLSPVCIRTQQLLLLALVGIGLQMILFVNSLLLISLCLPVFEMNTSLLWQKIKMKEKLDYTELI